MMFKCRTLDIEVQDMEEIRPGSFGLPRKKQVARQNFSLED